VATDGEAISFVATDGRTLKCIKRPYKSSKTQRFAVTFNRRASAALRVKFRKPVKLGFDGDEQVRVHGEKGELIYRDTLGMFPDYDAILGPALSSMTDGNTVEIEFDRLELLGKIEAMAGKGVKPEKFSSHWLYILLEDGMARLKYRNTKTKAMADDTIQPRMTTGDAVIAVSPGYLRQSLEAIKHQSVTLYVKPENGKKYPGLKGKATLSPMLMVPTEFEDDVRDFTLLMPMKTEAEKEEDLDFKEESQ
jgi:DNA polymerase III sliding clamp (beta) subunit (PCNA family)